MSEQYSEEQEITPEETQVSEEPTVEDQARALGWRPQDEYNGPQEHWRNAEEFLEHGQRHNGILRERLDKSTQQVADLQATVNDLSEHLRQADERAYKRAVKELQQAQREAVAEMDEAKFDRVTQQINELEPPTPKQERPQANPAFESWKMQNQWFDNDVEMTVYAHQAADILVRQGHVPESPLHLKAVEEEVRRKFADRFENPRRQSAPSVESPTPVQRQKQDPHSYANIPEEDKAVFRRFVDQGIYENTDEARKEFAAIYFEDDV